MLNRLRTVIVPVLPISESPSNFRKITKRFERVGGGGSKSQHAPAPLEAQVHFLELQLFKR